ncbi:MAG TPA: GDSL-type esterase/lipase family protein [Bryobacteraceae bacterium]|nr:GDSL-type esterase/lipase family protein [Bryobacteraceae bacterium]
MKSSGVVAVGSGLLVGAALVLSLPTGAFGQATAPPQPKNWTAAEDHQNMMDQLGIHSLRPGPSGNESAPNHANYDESAANPFPNLPDPLVLHNGKRVTTADMWWNERRPEIVEDFEREVYGRIPARVPAVSWKVTSTASIMSGAHAAIEKQLTGHVDNSSYPLINVDIQMTLVTPADRKRPVPVMMMFGRPPRAPSPQAGQGAPAGGDPPASEQLIADGWGYAYINPATIQADNGAGLTRGIIGLVNQGQARKPDDWGSLRAWAWGASRGLDYLQTDSAVDARHVGIEGVSRYGKAALVAMAFDLRFALVLVGSSGEGGAKLHRRNWGEAVENLTGAGEYHWMAGNFLKYGAAEATFGSKNAGDLPVDAHELIALCAPRLTFISYGVPEKGDAKWLDHQGSYMAAVAAGPVFRLLGARNLGIPEDYHTAKMPPVQVGLLDGQLAWRQHEGGHTDAPNWRYFLAWADRFLGRTPTASGEAPLAAADEIPRTDEASRIAHQDLLAKARSGRIDIYFEGDSITRRWGATDYPELLANWKQNFFGWNAADFGWGGDTTRNILWRLNHGELDGVNPKVVVLLAGTNDLTDRTEAGNDPARVTRSIQKILRVIESKAPNATIILMGIFPRNDDPNLLPLIEKINTNLSGFADGKTILYLNINDRLADRAGKLFAGMMNSRDQLHPMVKGYQVWADALKPLFTELLGAPGNEDFAPPPTGLWGQPFRAAAALPRGGPGGSPAAGRKARPHAGNYHDP